MSSHETSWAERLRDEQVSERQLGLVALIEEPDPAAVAVVRELLRDADAGTRQLAVVTLGGIGAPAVDGLIEAISSSQPHSCRVAAAAALARLGPAAEPAIPVLQNCLGDADEELRWHAGFALSRIGRNAVPALSEVLNSNDHVGRIDAADALARMGGLADEALPELAKQSASGDSPLRLACLAAQVQLAAESDDGYQASEILTELIAAGDDASQRPKVIAKLGLLGERGKAAVPKILGWLEEGTTAERCEAALALGRIQAADSQTVTALTAALADPEPEVLCHVAAALGSFGRDAESTVPRLEELTTASDPRVAAAAQQAKDLIQQAAADSTG